MNGHPQCALVGDSDELVGMAVPIDGGGFIVGRSWEASLRLLNDGVSRFHARVERSRDGKLVLSDLGSSNGTFLNDRRVSRPQPLGPGDRVRFGPRCAFIVRYGERGGGETLELVDSAHSDETLELLAKRNQGRLHFAHREYEAAAQLFADVLEALDSNLTVAAEDRSELLTELARCHVEMGAHARAQPLLRLAIELLDGASAGTRSLARAKFSLAQALASDDPDEAHGLAAQAAESLPPGDSVRQDIEAWIAVRDSASG